MSETIRQYSSMNGIADTLRVTAFLGGEKYGQCVQLTIGTSTHVQLSEKQTLDLIASLAKRVKCEDGFTATGVSDDIVVLPDGSSEVLED